MVIRARCDKNYRIKMVIIIYRCHPERQMQALFMRSIFWIFTKVGENLFLYCAMLTKRLFVVFMSVVTIVVIQNF